MDADTIGPWLVDRVDPAFEACAVSRIGVGHSRAMYCVTAASGARVVVRVEQGGVFGTDSREECRVMRRLRAAGAPVAAIVAEDEDGTLLGHPFFVMEHLGAAADSAAAADERVVESAVAESFVDTLQRLHELNGTDATDGTGSPDWGFDVVPPTPSDATHVQIDRWRAVHASAGSSADPLIDEAAAWLHHFAPPLDHLAVVHGDAGPGNFVHADGQVVALTDWEFAHLGDPAEDWSFCLSMRGARTMPRDAWLEMFERRAGIVLDDEQWRYWEAFNLFKGACANRTCLDLFERGVNPAPNMAIIGTTLYQLFLRRLTDIVHARPAHGPAQRPDTTRPTTRLTTRPTTRPTTRRTG